MHCEYCEDQGYEPIALGDGYQAYRVCEHCDAGRRIKYRGIPERALNWGFDNFPVQLNITITVNGKTAGIDAVRRAFVESDKWLVFSGPVGTGKTSLAVSGYKLLRDRGENARFWNVGDLLSRAKNTWGNPDLECPVQKLHRRYDLLVLDGMGETRLIDWDRDALSQLLGQRYSNCLRTVITTNWGANQFEGELGKWVGDRLNDVATLITLSGKSMRGRDRA